MTGGEKISWAFDRRLSWPPNSIQTAALSPRARTGADAALANVRTETPARNCHRKPLRTIFFCASSLMISPSPILCNAHTEQARIGQEHIGGQAAVVGVQEGARDIGDVEDVLHITH